MAQNKRGNKLNTRPARVVISVIGIFVSIFDLCSDWYAFSKFEKNETGKQTLTICQGVMCALSTILFTVEFYQGVKSASLYRKSKEEDYSEENIDMDNPTYQPNIGNSQEPGGNARSVQKKKERKVERLLEIVTFLLLICEDVPSAIIMYYAHKFGDCQLWAAIFGDESIVAYLSLSGIMVSAIWKGLQSLLYLVQCCQCYDIKDCEGKVVCCICRIFRPFVAVVLVIFVSFLILLFFFDFEWPLVFGEFSLGLEKRYNCTNVTTLMDFNNHTSVNQ